MNENQNNNINEGKVVKTYAEDMAGALENTGGGMIKNIIHGEALHEVERKNLSPESTQNKIFILVGFVFILAAIVTLFFFLPRKDVAIVPIQKQFTPLIFNDRITLVEVKNLSKEKIVQKVTTELGKLNIKDGGIGGAYLTLDKTPVGLRKFIEITESNFLPGDVRLVDDNFLIGVVKNDAAEPDREFFMLIKINSLADVFGPIHDWEKKMFEDLYGFFGIKLSPDTKYLLTKSFEDSIVENKNARVLYGNGGPEANDIVMMYVMVDNEAIIITSSEHATEEIIRRLASGKIKK